MCAYLNVDVISVSEEDGVIDVVRGKEKYFGSVRFEKEEF